MRASLIAITLTALLLAPAAADPTTVPVPAGWQALDAEYRYGPDDLWQYINGAAELFHTYGFRELAVRDLEREGRVVTLSVYDMGEPLGAFGVFEREGPADRERLTGVGAAAVLQPPYQGLMFKDRFYVKLESGTGDVNAEEMRALLSSVAEALPGTDSPPPELSLLPEAHRLPGSVAYTGRDFMGLADLRRCLHADYRDPDTGREYRLFALRAEGDPFATFSRQWRVQEIAGEVWAWREIPYQGVVLLRRTPTGAMGVTGCEDRAQAEALLLRAAGDGDA